MYALYVESDNRFAFSVEDNGGVDITDEYYNEIFVGHSAGKIISKDGNGYPIIVDSPAPTDEQLATSARAQRDQLLAETDYLLMPDYPITTEKMALVKTYRQLLRDITKQAGFPTTIDWPVMPE